MSRNLLNFWYCVKHMANWLTIHIIVTIMVINRINRLINETKLEKKGDIDWIN